MASIHPSWKEIDKFHNKLTEGERHIAKYLESNLSDEWEIYVQPFLNGCRPDIVLLSKKYGVVIVEVKDWNLGNYYFKNKKLYVKAKNGSHLLEEPIQQVRYYSDNLKYLIPYFDIKIDKNYRLIRKLLYFHNESQLNVDEFFPPVWSNEVLIGNDGLDTEKLSDFVYYDISADYLMDDETVKNIKTWLQPPFHSKEQIEAIVLNSEQAKYAKPKAGFHSLRGVAGSGKTLIVAYRAAALAAMGKKVLIVSFNKTLWHYIHDKVKSAPFDFDNKLIVYQHFHGFCNDMLNELSYPFPPIEEYFSSITHYVECALQGASYKGITTDDLNYDAILIDEGQDFEAEWIELLQKFLRGRKELFLVCDEAQNIYTHNLDWIETIDKIKGSAVQREELSKCIRLPKLIAEEANRFSKMYLPNIELHPIPSQTKIFEFDPILRWISCKDDEEAKSQAEAAYNYLYSEIKQQPTDIVMLFPNVRMGEEMVDRFEKRNINVNHVFNRNSKKSFWMGDSRTKMSTIHSFKGWELKNIIVIVRFNKPYHVFTAISRAMENLIVINIASKYDNYGKDWPNTEPFNITD